MLVAKAFTERVDTNKFMVVLVNDVLPIMNPYPAERSILLLDNATPHNKAAIAAACALVGVLVLYLPPYSYDFQPIEKMFALGKRMLVKRALKTNTPLPVQFENAMLECCDSDTACNIFMNCGWHVTHQERIDAR